MKKLYIFLISLIISLHSTAQNKELWGMTNSGGSDNIGAIIKTDANGNNLVVANSFEIDVSGANPLCSMIQASDGKLYGMTQQGGSRSQGVLFQYDPVNNTYIKKIDFDSLDKGSYPRGSLTLGSDGKLYGMTTQGGSSAVGVLFQYDPVTNIYVKKIDFGGTAKGSSPYGSMTQSSDGKLYGMTSSGGTNNMGVLFQYDPVTNIYVKKFDFDGTSKGKFPYGSLIQANDGMLYGMTYQGGTTDQGVLFQYDPVTNSYVKKLDFEGAAKGSNPHDSLIQASDGKLYGLTLQGGTNSVGVLFQYDHVTNAFVKKFDFDGTTKGFYSRGSLTQATDGRLYGMTQGGGTNNLGVLFQYDPVTNTYVKKLDFDGTAKGNSPYGSLAQATDGKLYGMTNGGGTNSVGVLFQYNPVTDTYIKKLDFDSRDEGSNPNGSLIQATDSKLYGMNHQSGTSNKGVLFQYDPVTNTYVKKLDFDGTTKGGFPYGSLIQATDGKLYGMTQGGGANNMGVLFQYDLVTNIYVKKLDFDGTAKGSYPYGSLTQASDGKLYGMTSYGGTTNQGVLFQYDPVTNTYIKKIDFDGTAKGSYPHGSLIQATDDKLYGMTQGGGTNNMGVLFQYDPVTNTYIKKIDFDGAAKGSYPFGSLTQASDGKLYGLTNQGGGSASRGVLFQYDPVTNTYVKKLDFDGNAKGSYPYGSLTQASDGKLYGLTSSGGTGNWGVLFQYDPETSSYIKKTDFIGTNGAIPRYGHLIEVDLCLGQMLTPSVSIATNDNNLCGGSSITITATPTNGGSFPIYDFRVNDVSVQNGSSAIYESTSFVNGDVVTCIMTSNNICQTITTATSATITIVVNSNVTPTFTQVPAICFGTTLAELPITSDNGITGIWSPALNNNETTEYTFTPTEGLCASTATMTITVSPNVTPTFTQLPAICSGDSLSSLPTTSNNGIEGTWSPVLNNEATTEYTFTPAVGECATTATMAIEVNQCSQVFCYGARVSNLTPSGAGIKWYASEAAVTPLSATALLTTKTYYYTETVGNIVSARIPEVVEINPTSIAGSVSGAYGTICYNSGKILTLSTTHRGSVQWQSAPLLPEGVPGTFSDIVGETGNTLNTGNLIATTYFRAVVTSGLCSSKNTAPVKVNVRLQSLAGTIAGGGATVCPGTNSTLLTLSGQVGSVQWYSSTNNIDFVSLAPYGKSASWRARNLITTTYYRVEVTKGIGCTPAISQSVVVNVKPVTNAGIVSGTSTIPYNTRATLEVTGYDVGATLLWKHSRIVTGVYYNGDQPIITNATYVTAKLLGDVYYRVTVTKDGCSSSTAPFLVDVNTLGKFEEANTSSVQFNVIAYPNPSSSEFTIQTSAKGAMSVKVYDMQGRLVQKANTDKVGSKLAAGTYNVIVNQGANTKSVRVIKN